ncbi:hypothetical protein SAMN05216302_10462 [Nitrosomonas aestuarii]|uniref:Uncharacterized protein n=1 Tax=Nitrosomonas aestuarii TaxID=52441 RepID=A0A1I4G373_9PROT|nr:hypothetical protein [Nitrosomonas aestuarii]SFL23687.1 hypothetical protein SAMN05216302_10462 [Nitrosomonas aestuarii]
MIHFPVLRMRRMTVQMRELTIGESISIASTPPHLEEASCSAFLKHVVDSVQTNFDGLDNPDNWTVQERLMTVCHYIAATTEAGPDFELGGGRYTDYLDATNDGAMTDNPIEVGEVNGDVWCIRHLTGAMAEAIERVEGEIKGVSGRIHWILGAMSCQLVRKDEETPELFDSSGIDQFIVSRMQIIFAFPESDFEQLVFKFMAGRDKLHHLFITDFSDNGIVAMPVSKTEGGEAKKLPPARFPVRACISRVALELAGKPNVHGG